MEQTCNIFEDKFKDFKLFIALKETVGNFCIKFSDKSNFCKVGRFSKTSLFKLLIRLPDNLISRILRKPLKLKPSIVLI